MRALVTGGAGYIGSHTLVELLAADHDAIVLDNFSNSSPVALQRVQRLSNRDFGQQEGNILDEDVLEQVFSTFKPEIVIHFAGLKAVEESQQLPLDYYENNITGSLKLLRMMERYGCKRIVFSSSATVYGEAKYLPYDEKHPVAPVTPYGRTKAMVESIIADWVASRDDASAVILRYFNPVGAHPSGSIGENSNGVPSNLMPLLMRVTAGKQCHIEIFGSDYDTKDGTGERDFIHVVDLAQAHLAAMEYSQNQKGVHTFNVGTGKGTSVLEMIAALEMASGCKIPYKVASLRHGDVASSIACVDLASKKLKWKATRSLKTICESTCKWQNNNPEGY